MRGLRQSIEVFLIWGAGVDACVLRVAHLRPGDHFRVGDVDVVTWERDEGSPVREGEVAVVSLGELTVRSRLVEEEAWTTPLDLDRSFRLAHGLTLSALAHVVCAALLALTLSPRALGGTDREITPDQIATMRTLLAASAERTPPDPSSDRTAALREARRDLASSSRPAALPPPRAATEAGAGGDAARPLAAAAPARVPAPQAGEREEARGFGMVGLLRQLAVDPDEPVPWKDALASLGAREARMHGMFDDEKIENAGVGGLTLSEVGSGGGGKVGLGEDPEESGPWHPPTWSRAIEALPPVPYHGLPGRAAPGPVRTRAEMLADAGLTGDVIRRVIQANAGRVRECYESGLRRNPALAGRVVVGFTIGEGGAVVYAKDEGSDLADPAVRDCIVRAFYSLGFPAPKGGQVTVKYPFALHPGE